MMIDTELEKETRDIHIGFKDGRALGRINQSTMQCLELATRVRTARLELPGRTMVEIGVQHGGSLAVIGRASENSRLYGIDPLDGWYGQRNTDPTSGVEISPSVVRHNLDAFKIKNVTLVEKRSQDVSEEEWAEIYGPLGISFIHVDGAHHQAGVNCDLEIAGRWLLPGGYLVIDDYTNPKTPDVQTAVDRKSGWLNERFHPGIHFSRAVIFRKKE